MMQIVIDITDSDKEIIDNGFKSSEVSVNFYKRLIMAIQQGTPLPKGHGRLIDADDLMKRAKQYIDSPNKYISQRNKDFIYYLELEEVIIPADKE